MAAAAVRHHDHEVTQAQDGREGWEHYVEQRPDVILTDRRMPRMDGLELVRRIRDDDTDHYPFIILVTALGSRDQVLEGMHAGADDYLVKPIDPFELHMRLIAAARTTALHARIRDATAELSATNAQLSTLARTDQLTEVGNRLRMDEDLRAVHARAKRDGHPYAIAFIDIDHFKSYNDTYGHAEGDEALHRVAACVEANSREIDGVYRYGGEELAVVMPATNQEEGLIAAERLRGALESLSIPHQADERVGVLTISIGVAALGTRTGVSSEDVLAEADQALYRAKSGGRNTVAAGL